MLEIGTKAPDFILPDINENLVSLKDFKGEKFILWFSQKPIRPVEQWKVKDSVMNSKNLKKTIIQ